ncbi:MAG: class I SAM-dependent methyltransferase [Alphaproteobacteria bacterium]
MSNQDQAEYWSGDAGQRWVKSSALLDAMLLPFAEEITRQAQINKNDSVLDIGCGAGALSFMVAETAQEVLGADISSPLIELAVKRTGELGNVRFVLADAAELYLERKINLIVSRFGVMFFNDPVAAFSNIRRLLDPEGRMVFACWQSPMKNMWARAPLEAAMPFFETPPIPPKPHAPGPFAFADSGYLTQVLKDAGWKSVDVENWSGKIRLPGSNTEEVAAFMMEMGPLSRVLKEQGLDIQVVRGALVAMLDQQANDDGSVDLGGAAWIVRAVP